MQCGMLARAIELYLSQDFPRVDLCFTTNVSCAYATPTCSILNAVGLPSASCPDTRATRAILDQKIESIQLTATQLKKRQTFSVPKDLAVVASRKSAQMSSKASGSRERNSRKEGNRAAASCLAASA